MVCAWELRIFLESKGADERHATRSRLLLASLRSPRVQDAVEHRDHRNSVSLSKYSAAQGVIVS